MKKKPKKKYVPFVQSKMSFIQIKVFMEPLVTFLEQIEKDSIWVDEKGNVLMDFPNQMVEEMANKGKEPRHEIPNINALLEAYFQITAYCFSDENLEAVDDQINAFKRKIINPLRLGSPISRQSVAEAKQLCRDYEACIAKAPAAKVGEVSRRISEVIQIAHDNGSETVNTKDMRKWLMDWAESKKEAAA